MTAAQHTQQRAWVAASLLCDEQREHRHDAPARGYRAPVCQCGHARGDHATGGDRGLRPSLPGVCYVRGCECAAFHKESHDA